MASLLSFDAHLADLFDVVSPADPSSVLGCSAIFDGYLDDLLTFDELLMPSMEGFGDPARPGSRADGGAGPSSGGHLGSGLGDDLGGLCSNCWCGTTQVSCKIVPTSKGHISSRIGTALGPPLAATAAAPSERTWAACAPIAGAA